MLFMLLISKKRIIIDEHILFVIIIQGLYLLFVILLYNNNYSNFNLFMQLLSLFLIITFIDSYIGFENFVRSYINVMLIMGIGGAIIFFIHAFIGLSPIFEVQYSEGGITYFFGLTSTNYYYYINDIRFLRVAGFFDEPGAFALFSLFAILLNKIYFDNRKVEKYLIIFTLFTFSMAFYIIMIGYYFLFYFNRSNLKYLVLLSFCIGAASSYLSNYEGNNRTIDYLYKATVQRLENDEMGMNAVDKRIARGAGDKKIFLDYPFWGVQNTNEVRGANIYSVIANHGLFGSLFYYAFLVYFLFSLFKLKGSTRVLFLKSFIVILANFFHRPEFFSVFTLLIIYSMIRYMNLYSKKIRVTNSYQRRSVKDLHVINPGLIA